MTEHEEFPDRIDHTPELDALLDELNEMVTDVCRPAIIALSQRLNPPGSTKHHVSLMLMALPMIEVESLPRPEGKTGFAGSGTLLFANLDPVADVHGAADVMLGDVVSSLARERKANAELVRHEEQAAEHRARRSQRRRRAMH